MGGASTPVSLPIRQVFYTYLTGIFDLSCGGPVQLRGAYGSPLGAICAGALQFQTLVGQGKLPLIVSIQMVRSDNIDIAVVK
jgi:hypothetical protein